LRRTKRPAHALDEAPRNGEPEAAAAMLARDRIVALLEIVKDRLAPIERHARSRVGNGNGERAAFPRDPQTDPAAPGEFDRIARNIEQDLPQARRVSHHLRGHIGRDEARNLQPFRMSARRQQLDDTFHQRRDRKRLADDVELARLDTREIEQVFDQRAERLARGADRLDIAFLLIINGSGSQQIGHAENAIQRRADLMTDGREKARLRLARRLGPVARLPRRAIRRPRRATARARVRRRACAGRSGEW